MLLDSEYLERLRTFLANRAIFPVEELAKHAGKWVAFSPDGTRVAASAPNPDLLEDLLRACGEDPAICVIEGIPGEGGLFEPDKTG
jgi:hypothetical protein